MLAPRFVPHNEFHVFRGTEWLFSVAELRLRHMSLMQPQSLAHQYCLRAPGFDQVAFDTRDIKRMDREAAWDPFLRVGKLTHQLNKSFDNVKDIIDAIAPFMCPLDASVRFETTPRTADVTMPL
ncbi:hypothetical protein [Dyella japonica]|uniref:Uncharacterized protein n=1 Tax=Dyella japonica A8 TaxID=1217721 RepID=A0A075K4Q7_9GAMM|nr:hypothetical protein [Dyella japonica]AIF48687.1 hypothetical protein HY57_16305 [Dyella japonica A8]